MLTFLNLALELAIWYGPLNHRRLIRYGQPAVATVKKRIAYAGAKGGVTYFVNYSFSSPQGVIQADDKLDKNDFAVVREGQKLTVVYDPKNAQNCTLYRFAHFRAEQSGRSLG